MNKNIKRLGIIVLCIVCIVCIAVARIYFTPAPAYIRIPLLENEEDYTRIAEIYYNDYLSNHQRLNQDVMPYTIAEYSMIGSIADGCFSEKGCVEPENIRYIELDEKDTVSANVIVNTYKMMDNKGWDRVYVYDSFVAFCTVDGRESLVYSVDGKRPSYVNAPDDDSGHISVYRITKHWFYCCKKWIYE